MFDLLLKNARVVDGTGGPWFRADVAIEQGIVGKVARSIEAEAERTIDLGGLALAPGFIDLHSHSDLWLLADPLAEAKIRQGITTELIGQDGLGAAPVPEHLKQTWTEYLAGVNGRLEEPWGWNSFGDYLSTLERRIAINVVVLASHGCVRMSAMGLEPRPATDDELACMCRVAREALQDGARGFSTGLSYTPCLFADSRELLALGRETARENGIFSVHIRNEGSQIIEALDEMGAIARETGVSLHITHLKAAGKPNWGRAREILEHLETMRSRGLEVTFDQYPYTAGSTLLGALLPDWVYGEGKTLERLKDRQTRTRILEEMRASRPLEGIFIASTSTPGNKPLEGKSVLEAAKLRNQAPFEAVLDILVEERLAVSMVTFIMAEEDVETILRHPLGMVSTDGLPGSHPHPRVYGSFPRILGRYVRERRILPLEEAVRKMTSAPARLLGLSNRGLIRQGFAADLVAFDPDTVLDRATYEQPCQFPAGVEYVIVNGKLVLERGRRHPIFPGTIL